MTPASFPQMQAPIVDNPAFWERLSLDPLGTDALFFAFYHQQVLSHFLWPFGSFSSLFELLEYVFN